jgi:hypothetical protein
MTRFTQSFGRHAFQARSDSGLTNEQIMQYAPSVFASEAHESRGERYAFIPTSTVLTGLRNEGFMPVAVAQTRCRDVTKREFTKHMVRMRHERALLDDKAEHTEIILLNSHDGTSSYQIMSGVFRMVCANGLVTGNIHDDVRVRHTGRVVDDVIEASWKVLDQAKDVEARMGEFKAIELSLPEQRVFANTALSLRWDGQAPVDADRVLRPNRWADKNNDLWTIFNRVQENLVKGGMSGFSATGRRMSTRAVGGVNENIKLNKALWQLADGMAQIKRGTINIEEVALAV